MSERTPFDPNLFRTLGEKSIGDNRGLIVKVKSYNNGKPKVYVTTWWLDKSGQRQWKKFPDGEMKPDNSIALEMMLNVLNASNEIMAEAMTNQTAPQVTPQDVPQPDQDIPF